MSLLLLAVTFIVSAGGNTEWRVLSRTGEGLVPACARAILGVPPLSLDPPGGLRAWLDAVWARKTSLDHSTQDLKRRCPFLSWNSYMVLCRTDSQLPFNATVRLA
jgi:hypothetical protein